MTIKLPEDFFFGADILKFQTNGIHNINRNVYSNWDMYTNHGINVFDYEDVIKLLKSMNFKSLRISIQWSRLLDQDGNINLEEAAWYHQLIDCANENGIDIFIDISHADMPEYLVKRGGWQNREVVEAYVGFVKKALEEYGQKVKYWFIANESVIEAKQQFIGEDRNFYLNDFKQLINIQYNITLAHCLAVITFRKLKKVGKLIQKAMIGSINTFAPVYTKDDPTPEDIEAARMVDGLYNRWWLDVVAHGHLPNDVLDTIENDWKVSIDYRPGDKAILANGKVDWLGFNYYQPIRIQAPGSKFSENGSSCLAKEYVWPERKMDVYCNREIYPKAIYDFGMKIKIECSNLPFFVIENEIGIEKEDNDIDEAGIIQDNDCIEFIREHLEWIAKAIEDGVNCIGYHYLKALSQDYKSIEKKSINWIKEVARTNEF